MRRGGLLWCALVAYLAALAYVLLASDERFLDRIAVRVYTTLSDGGLTRVEPAHYEVALNLLLFVPLGWLGVLVTRRSAAVVAVSCTWISLMVEVLQRGVLDRPGSVVDVMAAAFGSMLGAILGAWTSRETA